MTNMTGGFTTETMDKTMEKKTMGFADTMTEQAGLDTEETKLDAKLATLPPKKVERWIKRLMDYDKTISRAQAERVAALHFKDEEDKKIWVDEDTDEYLKAQGVELYYDELRDRVMISYTATGKTKIMNGAIETTLALKMQQDNKNHLSLPQSEKFIHATITATMNRSCKNIIRDELLGGLSVDEFGAVYKDKTDKINTLFNDIMDIHDEQTKRELTVFFGCAARQMTLNTIENGYFMECMLVLVGKQRKGKSTLCKRLMPWKLYFKRVKNFDPKNKDDRMFLHSAALVEIAEARDIFKNTSRDWWKGEITNEADEDRPPYAPAAFPIPRHVAYICTTNDYDLIFDNTGTRRYVFAELGDKFRIPRLEKYDEEWWKGLWRQFLSLAINYPELLYLDDDEYAEQEKRNESYRVMNSMEAQIKSILAFKDKREEIVWRQKPITPADFGREMAKYASKSKLFALMTKGVKYENATSIGKMFTRWADVGLIRRVGTPKHYTYYLPVYINELYEDLLEAHGEDGFPHPHRLPDVERDEQDKVHEVVRWDERTRRYETDDYPQDEPYKSMWVKTYKEFLDREQDNTAVSKGEIIFRAEQHADRIVAHNRELNEDDEW